MRVLPARLHAFCGLGLGHKAYDNVVLFYSSSNLRRWSSVGKDWTAPSRSGETFKGSVHKWRYRVGDWQLGWVDLLVSLWYNSNFWILTERWLGQLVRMPHRVPFKVVLQYCVSIRPLLLSQNLLLGAATGSNTALNVKSSICLSDESAAGISSVSLLLTYSTRSAIAAVDTEQLRL